MGYLSQCGERFFPARSFRKNLGPFSGQSWGYTLFLGCFSVGMPRRVRPINCSGHTMCRRTGKFCLMIRFISKGSMGNQASLIV